MESLSRPELNAYALTLGIRHPETYRNKADLQAEVAAHHAAREAYSAATGPQVPLDATSDPEGTPTPADPGESGEIYSGGKGTIDQAPDSITDPDGDEEPDADAMAPPNELDEGCIRVRGMSKESFVSFAEVHEDHPGGQAWIVGPAEAVVAETPAVTRALQRKLIERVQ